MLKVVGVGNRWRRDDAAGLLVAELLAQRGLAGVEVIEHEGEPLDLIDTCSGAQAVWLVDAASSGAAPGSVHRFDASERELPSSMFRVSTHRLGVGEALELARTLGRLPPRVTVYGVEGARFDAGAELSPAVAAAARGVAAAIGEEVVAC
jgi:hydrogenase maturation protease